jgi:hypothetical protein
MFKIRFRALRCLGFDQASACAATVQQALNFVGVFAPGGCGVIGSPWAARGGRYVMDVYDWIDCCFPDPHVLAEVFAPPGFKPPGEDRGGISCLQIDNSPSRRGR